jgi:CheY-like chemotaxis protein/HPt (histidine-containing phosphotransfer) domain-containing protein
VVELRKAFEDGAPFEILVVDWQLQGGGGAALARNLRTLKGFPSPRVILLSSALPESRSSAIAQTAIDAIIDKPARPAQLRRMILRLLGRGAKTIPPFERVSRSPVAARGLRLLLVEDNLSNQMVATMMLEHHGHEIDKASNGLEALERLSQKSYDAVLMDCQMPEMDGYEATRRIRSGSIPGVPTRVPIIALTAHALPTDRAKCLEVGMDDYVSKPIDAASLQAALSRCGVATRGGRPDVQHIRVLDNEESAVLDEGQLGQLRELQNPAGPGTLAHGVASLFMQEMPGRLEELRRYTTAHDGEHLGRAAHTLAGSCASLGARRLRALSRDLEAAAKSGNWEKAAEGVVAVEQAVEELSLELTRLELIS